MNTDNRPLRYALTISLTYLVAGISYIVSSDLLLAKFAKSVEEILYFEVYKGVMFFLVSAAGLFFFSRFLFRKIADDQALLIRNQKAILESERRASAGLLASCLAHDCNNILSVITLRLEQLNIICTDPEAKEALVKIKEANERLISIMGKLKTSSNVEADKPQTVDLNLVAQECSHIATKHKAFMGCQYDFRPAPEKTLVFGSTTLLHQMILNLLINAAEATRPYTSEGRVTLIVENTHDSAVLRVEDNGPGIPKEITESLFMPFFTTKPSGSGLGLLSVRHCVDQHKGTLHIDRSTLGGAAFVISLPHS